MKAQELREVLQSAVSHDLVMVRTENGVLHSVKAVVPETHEDADGSTTFWIEVTEH